MGLGFAGLGTLRSKKIDLLLLTNGVVRQAAASGRNVLFLRLDHNVGSAPPRCLHAAGGRQRSPGASRIRGRHTSAPTRVRRLWNWRVCMMTCTGSDHSRPISRMTGRGLPRLRPRTARRVLPPGAGRRWKPRIPSMLWSSPLAAPGGGSPPDGPYDEPARAIGRPWQMLPLLRALPLGHDAVRTRFSVVVPRAARVMRELLRGRKLDALGRCVQATCTARWPQSAGMCVARTVRQESAA